MLLPPYIVSSRPLFSKAFFRHYRHKRLYQKLFYCFQHCVKIIGFNIYLSAKCFPFLLHCIIFGKSHNLLKLFYRKGVSTIFKSLFKCFCQRSTIKIELIGKIINIIIIFHSA